MVEVHAEISRVSKPLLGRTLSTLLEETAKVALECFRQVPRFGMGGMLSVRPHSPPASAATGR